MTELLSEAHEAHPSHGYHRLARDVFRQTGWIFSDNLAHKCCKAAGIHSRARKYADAIIGRYDKDEALKQIKDKRNKDSLMAYALLPVKDEDDIFSRYMLFKQFKKESTKFGAQRRASESAASDMAMRNLALNAGFSDVTRLTLRMETKLFADIKPMTEPNVMGDVTIRLNVDENGKAELICEKGGKTLKSVPAKYKKDELNIRMGEVKKQLTEQYRRTRQMLEQAMEDRTVFLAGELDGLRDNPVVSPLISRLVFVSGKNLGFFEDMKLIMLGGKSVKLKPESELIVAHPLDLYNCGNWSEYQKMMFDRQITQPFKQVFRELYVKTDEEKEAFTSMRYAGNQVQPILPQNTPLGCGHRGRLAENLLQREHHSSHLCACRLVLPCRCRVTDARMGRFL